MRYRYMIYYIFDFFLKKFIIIYSRIVYFGITVFNVDMIAFQRYILNGCSFIKKIQGVIK